MKKREENGKEKEVEEIVYREKEKQKKGTINADDGGDNE